MNVPSTIIDAISSMHRPIVIAHVRPDADALGSAYAVALAYTDAECQPRVCLPPGSLSKRLIFLHEWAKVTPARLEDFARADGFITVDTARLDRCNVFESLRNEAWSAKRPLINIDHHATNENYGMESWIVPDAGSASELVYHLLVAAGRPITPTTASMLYAGMHSDTNGFSLPTTKPSALQAAADLAERGADIARLGERLCRSLTQAEFDLLRVIYRNTRSLAGGRLTYSTASYEEIASTGCNAADIDDQITVPRSMDGAVLSILFTEGLQGKTRINLRGAGTVSVVELAQSFGGGGHRQAAGAILDVPVDQAVEQVVPAAEKLLNNINP